LHALLKQVLILLAFSAPAVAQEYGHDWVTTSPPSGSCPGPSELAIVLPAGDIYRCSGSPLTWSASAVASHVPKPSTAGYPHWLGSSWTYDTPSSSGGLPSGLIAISLTSCPSGFTEVASLSGQMLRGTVAANADVGTTGGNATITPSGTVSQPSFTGTSNQATSAVSAGTPSGTNGTVSFTPAGTIAWPASVPAFTGSALAAHQHELPFQDPSASGTTNFRGTAPATFGTGTSRAAVWGITTTSVTTAAAVALSQAVSGGTPAGTIGWPASVPGFTGSTGTVPAETFTGSALGTHSHTITPAGTVSQPSFAGNAVDPSPPFMKVIFCQSN
jgi:hypothetical protein